jgi:hypothetical protein
MQLPALSKQLGGGKIEISFFVIAKIKNVLLTPSFPRNCIDAFDVDPYLFCKRFFELRNRFRNHFDASASLLSLTNCPRQQKISRGQRTQKKVKLRFEKWLIIASAMRMRP